MIRRMPLLLLVVPVLASSCSSGSIEPGQGLRAPRELELRLELAANLEPFADCEALLDYFQESAETLVGVQASPTPVGGFAGVAADRAAVAGATGGEAAPSGATSGLEAPAESGDFSQTNIQEAGVDEPDIVKNDGRRIVVAAQGRLQVVDPKGPRVVGSVQLPDGGHELFLHDDRVIVLTRSFQVMPLGGAEIATDVATDTAIYPSSSTTVVSAVDIGDPASPRIVESVTFEGDYVAARLHDGVVRLVLRSSPFVLPAAEDTTLEQWLPDQVVGSGEGGSVTEPLVPCDSVTRPPEPSGVGTVTVLTIDASGSMQPIDTDAVVADAQTVYASTETLYVATNQWYAPNAEPSAEAYTTELHAFDIADPEQTTYLASGRVRGQLLNQWSLSDRGGHLRVATTDGSPWAAAPDAAPSSESFLTVLERDGDMLQTVGQLGGLGRGEQIYAVRYIGDLGFVVTFRQTDPLYAIDLSDPENPRLLGELKIPGFSAYLHPIGGGRLLGVGQDATEDGQRLGTQVSLFDISDPANLRRLDQAAIQYASSAVEHDHRAFLWWARSDVAVMPIEVYGPPVGIRTVPGAEPGVAPTADIAPAQPFLGAAAFRVEGGDIELLGKVSHESKVAPAGAAPEFYGAPAIQRSLVIGASLFTVSEAGILASDLGSLADQGWAGF